MPPTIRSRRSCGYDCTPRIPRSSKCGWSRVKTGLKAHNNVPRLTSTNDVQKLSRICRGRLNVVLAASPLSAVAEMRWLGLEIRQRGVIPVLEKAGGAVIRVVAQLNIPGRVAKVPPAGDLQLCCGSRGRALLFRNVVQKGEPGW